MSESEHIEDDHKKQVRNFKREIKELFQNISSILVPLILVGNIEYSRLIIVVLPSLITIIFLSYDYYQYIKKKKNEIINNEENYSVIVKDKQELDDYTTNQLYKDIEFYINKKIMEKGMKSSLIDTHENINYIRNNYYEYLYNLKLAEKEMITFDYKGKEMHIVKDILATGANGTHHLRALRIISSEFNIIKDFLKNCQQEFKNYINNLEKVTYHFYRYNNESKKWISKKLKTIKNYENVILPIELEKQIKSWINTFNNSKEEYSKKGIPYKLSLMFYGVPGCGKTSLTYAIAYETNRNIYQVPLSSTISCEDLKNIIDTIPEGNIVLFEEVDTCPFFKKRELMNDNDANILYKQINILNQKKTTKKYNDIDTDENDENDENEYTDDNDSNIEELDDESEDNDEISNEDNATLNEKYKSNIEKNKFDNNKNKYKQFIKVPKLDLKETSKNIKPSMNLEAYDNIFNSYIKTQQFHLLEILDGYNYLHNNIVIMYTNYMHCIDNAIIRPGRIDHKVELKNANAYQVKKTYQLFYDKDISDDIAEMIAMRNITTSFLINTCIIPCFHNMEESIHLALNESIM
jgi:SpoVK/Ycf46/Vps4 family AAA+-type ATPase